ncbi:hypothetical protein CAPTEDRAFT_185275 [Capitella teleta]|uniref:Uncharacterized protein n=1 Tax=Capitella teleta TaxID=283909 RepID=R7T5K5_CAPTE|nr:hypothetical protein CAPTEDRAFT_185275 [Capitella teleta]|eukprot:ELT88331.1 hypothetical protein CAPTEDRAFT_185275 [Capitella teleta]
MDEERPVRPTRRGKSRIHQSTWTDPQFLEDTEDVATFRMHLEDILGPWGESCEEISVEEVVGMELENLEKSIQVRSHEDELKFRYRRMLLVAAALKKMYMEEKEHHREWMKRGAQTREDYIHVAVVMVRQCHETSLGWKQLATEKELEMTMLRGAYDDMVQRAAMSLENIELKLIDAEQRIKDLEGQLVEKIDVSTCTADIECDAVAQRADTAEMAAKNFELLFEIASNKLCVYEQEETKLRSAWKSLEQPKASFRSYTLPRGGGTSLQVHSDDISIASIDTTDASSMKTEPPTTHEPVPLSTSLRSLLQKPSPKLRKKKKSPFRHFMKRSTSQESQIQNIGSSFDRLPPISDSVVQDMELPNHNAHNETSIEETCNHNVLKRDEPKPASTVHRTMSFADSKASAKSGLVALAKDIEKRFKRKRRSKTADFSELSPRMKEADGLGCDNLMCYEPDSDGN